MLIIHIHLKIIQKGLGSLTISALPNLKKSFHKEHQNVSMITKNNLFTVKKMDFLNPRKYPYKKYLTFSYALLSKKPMFCLSYDVIFKNINKRSPRRTNRDTAIFCNCLFC